MEEIVVQLLEGSLGVKVSEIVMLPASGSARKYYRAYAGGKSYIGAFHRNMEENRLFIRFTEHFGQKGLHVPEIYGVSDDGLCYIQEDLGDRMLLDVAMEKREAEYLGKEAIDLYQRSLKELVRFQLLGGQGLDYSACIPRPEFDRRCILWDLNYFKYCFLKLAGTGFSEQALEEDFEALTDTLDRIGRDSFMFRDFQSRNIMVRDGEVWFIDYQGGRKGALQYDVASLLYDAIACIPDRQREELLDYYIKELKTYRAVDAGEFRQVYYRFALVRLLQAMGAFGLRGLYEGKQHFIDSILPGLQNILSLFEDTKLGKEYPAIRQACRMAVKK